MTENNLNTPSPSPFNNGLFVILLIAVMLLLLIVTWSVSFVGMLFGAFGAICSLACQRYLILDRSAFQVRHCSQQIPCDEKCAYCLVRAVLGMVFGTAAYALVFGASLAIVSGTVIAVIAFAVGFVLDYCLFAKHQSHS